MHPHERSSRRADGRSRPDSRRRDAISRTRSTTLPDSARLVVVGGGYIGCGRLDITARSRATRSTAASRSARLRTRRARLRASEAQERSRVRCTPASPGWPRRRRGVRFAEGGATLTRPCSTPPDGRRTGRPRPRGAGSRWNETVGRRRRGHRTRCTAYTRSRRDRPGPATRSRSPRRGRSSTAYAAATGTSTTCTSRPPVHPPESADGSRSGRRRLASMGAVYSSDFKACATHSGQPEGT